MKKTARQQIVNAVKHYQTCQKSGIKDIPKQVEIFTEDCLFMSFTAAAVVGTSGLKVYNGKKEICAGFQQYNDHIKKPENIDIEYFDLAVDEENLRCNFNMLLHIKTDSERPVEFFNMLQFHFNKDLKIYKAYNWQGDVGDIEIGPIVNLQLS